ncbi:PIN domain-containing protein [Pantoea eucrina]|uniref:type II toxin-antitoxin system VapC family toxin n=1 Tax=Pantoea eucrina TaxID=472693 RepID=UPI002FD89782
MAILVDTSVWVNHFKNPEAELQRLLNTDLVLMHPMILAEIACGTPPAPRQVTLSSLALLSQSSQASIAEVMQFIEDEKLFGLGCGLVDFTLLASALITPGARLWTVDKRLEKLALRFGINYPLTH